VSSGSLYDVLLRPVISEKSVAQTELGNYTFAVARDANKFQIKAAVEAEFKVDVLAVHVISVQPKQKRRGRKTPGTVRGLAQGGRDARSRPEDRTVRGGVGKPCHYEAIDRRALAFAR